MARLKARNRARRFTGVSTPFGGLAWNPPEDDRKTARGFVTFLEDRRVLYNPHYLEIEDQVVQSTLSIREKATEALGQLTEHSPAIVAIKGMRAACRRFLDQPHPSFPHLERSRLNHDSGFFVALGELRAAVGRYLATLIMAYDLEIEEELASILPVDSATEGRE